MPPERPRPCRHSRTTSATCDAAVRRHWGNPRRLYTGRGRGAHGGLSHARRRIPVQRRGGARQDGSRGGVRGAASTDFFGRFLVEHLRRESVGTRYLSRSSAPSTLAFVALVGREPAFTFYGDQAADTLLRPEDLPAGMAAAAVLHFGSISLLRGTTPATIAGPVPRLHGPTLLP